MKRENLNFLIEGRAIILIKYYILLLTTCYSQLVFILVYCSCKKFSFNFSNNIWFFGSLVVIYIYIYIYLLKYNHHYEYFIVFVKFLGWIVASCARLARLIGKEGG